MPDERPTMSRIAVGAALLLLGVLLLGGWKIASRTSDLPYDSGTTPPSTVQVTAGNTYQLAVPGGVLAMQAHGVPAVPENGSSVISLRCTYRTPGSLDASALSVTAEAMDTKLTDVVGEFVSPVSGSVHLECTGWGAMYVPDSDDRSTDFGLLALVLGVVALAVGSGLVLSGGYDGWSRSRDGLALDAG